LQWDRSDFAYDWAERFDDAVAEQMAHAPGDILKVLEHADYASAVPTPDHFIPLLYVAGLAAAQGAPAEALVRGYAMGSVSMTCYGLGARDVLRLEPTCAANLPEGVPPDQTNM
jgi:4,5-DOPA dioxygenase extradiol